MDAADPQPQDRHSAMLAELAAMSLTLARDLQARALEAESVEDATRLSPPFTRCRAGCARPWRLS
jgi:hypothetical protein